MIPSMSNQSEKGAIHFDMVNAGGGMVGLSMALMLAKQGEWKILLIESNSLDTVSYTHLRAHETLMNLVCRLLLEKN